MFSRLILITGSNCRYFRPDHSNPSLTENSKNSDEEEDGRCVTGIVWDKEKYKGTPLQIDDDRLSEFSPWLRKHNIVIVKLDSCQRYTGFLAMHANTYVHLIRTFKVCYFF